MLLITRFSPAPFFGVSLRRHFANCKIAWSYIQPEKAGCSVSPASADGSSSLLSTGACTTTASGASSRRSGGARWCRTDRPWFKRKCPCFQRTWCGHLALSLRKSAVGTAGNLLSKNEFLKIRITGRAMKIIHGHKHSPDAMDTVSGLSGRNPAHSSAKLITLNQKASSPPAASH